MSKRRRKSTTPEVDYIVNAIEVLLEAVFKVVGAFVALPFHVLRLTWKNANLNRQPSVTKRPQ